MDDSDRPHLHTGAVALHRITNEIAVAARGVHSSSEVLPELWIFQRPCDCRSTESRPSSTSVMRYANLANEVTDLPLAVARLGTGFLLQGADHGGCGCARIVIGRRPDGPPEPAGVVVDRDPPHAARHRLGGDARHQGNPEASGDEPESGGPVAGCEGDPRLGDAGPRAELRGRPPAGPGDPPLVCELVGLDPFPGGEGVLFRDRDPGAAGAGQRGEAQALKVVVLVVRRRSRRWRLQFPCGAPPPAASAWVLR